MWTSILGFVGKLGDWFAKVLPMLFAYKAGKSTSEKNAMEEAIDEKEKGEKAKQEAKEKIRENGVADYVRNNDI